LLKDEAKDPIGQIGIIDIGLDEPLLLAMPVNPMK
jgi:hypothetical protein